MELIAERCEELGVRTALIVWETAGPSAADEDATLFNAPSLDAIVSLGSSGFELELGQVERVIAPEPGVAEEFRGAVTVPALSLVGAIDHLGSSRLMAARY
jgi:hypothetical protein